MSKTLFFAACTAVFGAGGCKTVGVVGYPAEYVDAHGPSHVWVTEPSNSVVELWNPTMHGDTVTGFSKGAYEEIPLSDVKLMRANFAAPLRTALLAGGVAVGTAAIVATLMGNSPGATCITPGTDFVSPCVNPNNPNGHVIN